MLVLVYYFCAFGVISAANDEERVKLGEATLKELQKRSETNDCWKTALANLNSTCKQLNDVEQSRLAVSFSNCHFRKSRRPTYICNSTMSVEDCTEKMDDTAFLTYTEFFTHTGHICYFLQNEIWQEKTESTILQLSETSSETVRKLKESLKHQEVIEMKQNQALGAFQSMEEMANRHRDLLTEIYTSLKSSIDSVQYLMSLFMLELFGMETIVTIVISWIVIYFLPSFSYSRFYLCALLFAEQIVELGLKRIYTLNISDDIVSLCMYIEKG